MINIYNNVTRLLFKMVNNTIGVGLINQNGKYIDGSGLHYEEYDMILLNIFMTVIVLFIVPILIGNTTYGILKMERTLTESFLFGHITMWAICQFITVPLVLLKADFRVLVVLLTIIYVGYILYGLIRKYTCKVFLKIETIDKNEKILDNIAIVIMIFAVFILLLACVFLQHTDADDSRFVVNSVDTFRTNRMLLTDVNTGLPIDTWIGDLNKDVSSPWAIYCAYLAKVMLSHPTIVMHTILTPVLLLLACSTYWILSEQFIGNDILHRCIFVCIVILVQIYGCHSIFSSETFLLTRLWQGKAVVAGVGIPALIWQFVSMYYEEKYKRQIIRLVVTDVAMCLLSNMGIILGFFLIGCYGLVYGIEKKSFKYMIYTWLACIPSIIYIGVSFAV